MMMRMQVRVNAYEHLPWMMLWLVHIIMTMLLEIELGELSPRMP